ncbi:ROK family protein [Rhodobacteraceae bacterium F11138]|nr:ROK family protein [Rhodobacteraceae bacterium F11138]
MTGTLLVGDLGGTNCRLGLVAPGSGRIEDVRSLANDSATDFIALVRGYLNGRTMDRLTLAIAAPADGDRIPLTNRDWVIDRAEISAAFGLRELRIVNDFQALGHALARVESLDCVTVKPGEPSRQGTRIILGAGTGFNCSARLANGSVVVCEAGHTTFAPLTELDRRLQAAMSAKYTRCSVERLLSGSGLREIHALTTGGDADQIDGAQLIAQAMSDRDPAARASCETFARLLGQQAGDLALLFQATGGVWLSGGPTRALRPLIETRDGPFQRAFAAKGRMRPILERLPVHLVTSDQAAIAGCLALSNTGA